jgi:hypothetical protein
MSSGLMWIDAASGASAWHGVTNSAATKLGAQRNLCAPVLMRGSAGDQWNWASSVDPASASVEASPPAITCATSSK